MSEEPRRIEMIRLIKCQKCDIDTGVRECLLSGITIDYCLSCYLKEERRIMRESADVYIAEVEGIYPW
jgi:hypothetical protein